MYRIETKDSSILQAKLEREMSEVSKHEKFLTLYSLLKPLKRAAG